MYVYMDLSKNFDIINHNIMLSKIDYYGIRDTWSGSKSR